MTKKALNYYNRALKHKIKSESLLTQYVQEVAREKGFSEKEVLNFDADWASGIETVVKYNGMGEFEDLEVGFMAAMTKEEIIKRLDIQNEL